MAAISFNSLPMDSAQPLSFIKDVSSIDNECCYDNVEEEEEAPVYSSDMSKKRSR